MSKIINIRRSDTIFAEKKQNTKTETKRNDELTINISFDRKLTCQKMKKRIKNLAALWKNKKRNKTKTNGRQVALI